MSDDVTKHVDDFRGDNAALVASIDALLHLDDAKALVPHGLGGPSSHAYRLLCAAKHRLSTPSPDSGERMREVLEEARRQLEYLDGRFPTGTTPAVIARIDAALQEPAR